MLRLLDAEARSPVNVDDAFHFTDTKELPLREFLGDLGKILLIGVNLPLPQAIVSRRYAEPADLFGERPVVDDLFALTDVEDAFWLSRIRMDVIVPREGLINLENSLLELCQVGLILVPRHLKSERPAHGVLPLTADHFLLHPTHVEGPHRETLLLVNEPLR